MKPNFHSILLKIVQLLVVFVTITSYSQDAQVNGVSVYFHKTPDMFHESWTNSTIKATASTPQNINREEMIQMIAVELNKYPVNVVKNNLHKVYIVDSLSFYGARVGGSYFTGLGEGIIYINYGAIKTKENKFDRVFHHEFCSILYYTYKSIFPKSEWVSNNNIEYWDNTYKALNNPNISSGYQPEYASDGFICGYAVTSFDNDISCMAEALMAPGPYLYKYYDKYAGIHNKYDLLKQFYLSIDKDFKFVDMMSVAKL